MASAQQPAPSCRPQSRTRHAPCALPRPPSARPLARLPAALRLPASHRGRVLLEAAGQWGRRAESTRPMDAPLGPGGGRSQERGGAGSDPRLLVPSWAQGLCAPLWSSRWRWRHLSSLKREVTELKSPGLREALDGPRSKSARVYGSSFTPGSFCPSPALLSYSFQTSSPAPGPRAPAPVSD